MTGKHRVMLRPSRRPASRILGVLFAGAAVTFSAAAVIALHGGPALPPAGDEHKGDALAGPLPDRAADGASSPEPAAAPPDSVPPVAVDGQPIGAVQPNGTATRRFPASAVTPGAGVPEVGAPGNDFPGAGVSGAVAPGAVVSDPGAGPTPRPAAGGAVGRESAVPEALRPQASARTESAPPNPSGPASIVDQPAPSADQPPPPADHAEQPDSPNRGLVGTLLDHLGAGG